MKLGIDICRKLNYNRKYFGVFNNRMGRITPVCKRRIAMTDREEYAPDLLTLVDDEGQEHEFEIIDTLEHGEEHYIALVASYDDPEEQLQDDGELVILKSVFDGDEEFLEAIEDEAEFDEIAAIFMERLQDDYEFTGGDEESL